MTKTLDQTDEAIIAALRANARLPLVALAKRIGLSRSATQERLRRLETHSVIAGYTIRMAPPSGAAVRAWLSVRFKAGHRCADVVPFILQRSEVRLCHAIAGPIDLLILVETASNQSLAELRETLSAYDRIDEVVTAPVLTAHFE